MIKIFRSILFAVTVCFAISAYAGEAEDAIKVAKAAQKKASEVGGEWRDTGKLIKNAEKLLAEGKTAKAIEQARKAEMQGNLGYIQATSQN